MPPVTPSIADLPFVRRSWCLWLAAGLVLLGGLLNALYLLGDCPIDLSDDEAHYWEWSRHLDYGYYSKPPGIAWVIGAAIGIGRLLGLAGDGSGAALMPVMRMAAVLFGVLSGMISLLLARRIFRDDRAALVVILLSAAVPMFAVGSLLITIDSPMYLCWAATVYCLWRHLENHAMPAANAARASAVWLYAAGLACALGMLFKPVLVAIPLCAMLAAWADPAIRRALKSRHAAGAAALLLLSQIPVVMWNHAHGWVTFRHILTQGGLGTQAGRPPRTNLEWLLLDPLRRLGEYVGGQAGGMGGILFVLLTIAGYAAWRKIRDSRSESTDARQRSVWVFLLAFSAPLWGFYLVMNFWKGTQVNWPAASYFAGMILLAGIFLEGWTSPDLAHRRVWRFWGTLAIVWGVLLAAAIKNTHRGYALAASRLAPLAGTEAYFRSNWHPRKWDKPIVDKLRGMEERAMVVQNARQEMAARSGGDPLLVATRYGPASSLAFYLPDQPFVFSLMSYLGERRSQYDIWPDLNQRAPDGTLVHAGRDALIVGDIAENSLRDVIEPAFDRVDPPQRVGIRFDNVILKELVVRRAWGFKGLPASEAGGW